jgi:transposase
VGARTCRKRYLVHVAGYNLGLIMRLPVGAGTPREFVAGASAPLLARATVEGAVLVVVVVANGTEAAMLVVSFRPEPPD